jgi:hypothetical protein
MPELETKDRERLKDSQFAYIDKEGERHLPVNDKSHARNAMARFNQTDFDSTSEKRAAAKKIVGAARKKGIDVDPDAKVAKAAKRKT